MRTKHSLAALLFLVACGSDPPSQPDAGGTGDNNTAIVVNGVDGPMKDVHVVWINPDGKVAADTKTGDDGRAYAKIDQGASVTAEVDGLTTVLDLVPGEHVTLQAHAAPATPKDKGMLAVMFDTAAGATQYTLVSSCTQATGAKAPVDLPIKDSCASSGTLLAIASDASGMLSYAVDTKVKLAKGDYKVKSKWKDADTFSASLSGIDAAKEAAFKLSLTTELGYVTSSADIATSAATASADLKGAFDLHSGYALSVDDPSGKHHQTLLAPIDPAQPTAKLDLGKDLLAWISGATYDAKTRTATVTTSDGDKGTLLAIDLAYGAQKAWHVFGPSAKGALTVPSLPTAFDALAPAASDTVTATAALIDVEGDTYQTLQTIAPWAEYQYAGHPEVTAVHKVRVSR